jgi:FMN phosphatase YigB (HAD superfamily)
MANIDWSQVKVVSWDIDGTLYDLKAFMRALKRDLLIRAITFRWFSLIRDLVRLVRFKRHMDNVRHNCPDFSVGELSGRDEIGHTMDALYARLLPSIGMLPGVNGLLDWFDEQSVPQVIFSDYRPSTKLSALNLDGRFQSIFAGEDLGHLKPSPTVFREIIEQLGISPGELLHIGDRPDTDGAAASEVGFQVAIIGVDFDTADELAVHLQSTSKSQSLSPDR